MSFLDSDKAKMLAGKALLFPVNHPKITMGIIGAALLSKVIANIATPVTVGATLYNASQQGTHTELLNKLVEQGQPQVIDPINTSNLLGG